MVSFFPGLPDSERARREERCTTAEHVFWRRRSEAHGLQKRPIRLQRLRCQDDHSVTGAQVELLFEGRARALRSQATGRAQMWKASYNVNVVGGVMILKAAREHLRRAGGGAVVNFGSISAKVAQTGRWLYPVSKAAILQLTRTARRWISPPMGSASIRSHPAGPGRGS